MAVFNLLIGLLCPKSIKPSQKGIGKIQESSLFVDCLSANLAML